MFYNERVDVMIEHQKIIAKAIGYCLMSSKDYTTHEEIIACLKTQNSIVHSMFRYSIARDVANYLLSSYGCQIKELKLYGSTAEYTAGIYSDIDILIQVNRLSNDLAEALKQIDKFLCKEYYSLLSEDVDEWSYFIDTHIINDDPNEPKHPSRAYLEHILFNESVELLSA